ncbi:MAG: DNA repair protein RecN, partial [Chthoniobacterales bacterium]|nr:DNA repair protein RecN [Chthoniobacterales bacterium]
MPATLVLLRIRNFALVEDLEWEPGKGMNVVTGETGAGKSVLIGALKLLLGERADRGMIRSGAEQCVVEAAFEVPAEPDAGGEAIAGILTEAGVEPCEEGVLLLKRIVSEGGSRQFVNGSPCTLSVLRQLGDLLADLHGPHEHQSLFSREEQTRILDAYAGGEELMKKYRSERTKWLAMRKELESLNANVLAVNREVELLRHQIQEIRNANLQPGEERELQARHRAAANSRRILELGASALQALRDGDRSVLSLCGDLGRILKELARLDLRASGLEGKLMEMAELGKDLARELEEKMEEIELDAEELASLESRLDLLASLQRKYGNTTEEILRFAVEAEKRLQFLENREDRCKELDIEVQKIWDEVCRLGKELSSLRREGAEKLALAVRRELEELGFRQAGFEVHLDMLGEAAASGFELVEFLFAPNPGEARKPLRQIASSGEISRVMLALKCVLARQDRVAMLVFDEIDANVGGETATKVGQKMRKLGQTRQVLCITHLPQVAAAAHTHFLVEKRVKEGRT